MGFRRALALDELWRGDMTARVVGKTKLVVIRIDDGVYAYEDRCAHLGVALSEGSLDGRVLTCSAHHYQYDACTGRGINPKDVCLRAFPVRVDGGDVLVDVDDDGERS
jgi:toluene monooxygenase system ferredoxin subunit